MTNEQKANELGFKFFPDEQNIWARDNVEATKCALACLEMAQWKDEQLDSAIDKALQRNGDFLKQGKITQYGYDIAFITIQNIREYLNSNQLETGMSGQVNQFQSIY